MIGAKRLIATALEIDLKSIPNDASIETFSPWDSLGHMKIIGEVETLLGRSLEIEQILQLTDLSSLQRLMDSR